MRRLGHQSSMGTDRRETASQSWWSLSAEAIKSDVHWKYRCRCLKKKVPWSGISSSCLAVGRSSHTGQKSRWHPSLAGPKLSGSSPPAAPCWHTHTHRHILNSTWLCTYRNVIKVRGHINLALCETQTESTHTYNHLRRLCAQITAWEALCFWSEE